MTYKSRIAIVSIIVTTIIFVLILVAGSLMTKTVKKGNSPYDKCMYQTGNNKSWCDNHFIK